MSFWCFLERLTKQGDLWMWLAASQGLGVLLLLLLMNRWNTRKRRNAVITGRWRSVLVPLHYLLPPQNMWLFLLHLAFLTDTLKTSETRSKIKQAVYVLASYCLVLCYSNGKSNRTFRMPYLCLSQAQMLPSCLNFLMQLCRKVDLFLSWEFNADKSVHIT